MEHIIVKDQLIIEFYKENTNIDFITMNHIFIDILKFLIFKENITIYFFKCESLIHIKINTKLQILKSLQKITLIDTISNKI